MKIETLRELDKLIKLCRKRGVTNLKAEGLELSLSESEPVTQTSNKKSNKINRLQNTPTLDSIEEDALSEQDALFWSSDSQMPLSESITGE